jgi:RNA-directed DNA polymerase
MIGPQQIGEPASEGRSLDASSIDQELQNTEAVPETGEVVGESMSGKGSAVNTGDLPGQEAVRRLAGVRATVVATNPGNAGGAKGGRKAEASSNTPYEEPCPKVPMGDKQGQEDLRSRRRDYGAKRGVWSEKMLAALQNGVKGKVWYSLMDKVHREATLGQAWEQVKSNAGACGVDGMSVGRFDKDSHHRLLAVKELLKEGRYEPKPVKRVWIPKAGSAQGRPLGIPTVLDRVVQTALKMAIEPIFEREFAPHSYGFRPGRSCKDALRRVNELLQSGLVHVVDVDIKGYFDSIPHERLMGLVRERIADGRVLGLIKSFLKAGVMETMGETPSKAQEEGTPQGGVISPVLANVYLNPLDWLMSQAGVEMVRYADDMVMLCRDEAAATQALQTLREWTSQAGLELHPLKTKVVNMGQARAYFDFLGYRFRRTNAARSIRRFIRIKSLKSIKARIKPLTRRANGRSLEAIILLIRPILQGEYEYFKHVCKDALRELDGWVRGRLRAILRKRCGKRGRGRGRDHQVWPNSYFAKLGLLSLEQAREQENANLRKRVNC